MALTEEQQALLRSRRRKTPPSYYSADLGQTVQITQDTEDALILAPAAAKQQAVSYLKSLLSANLGTSESDELLKLFSEKQASVQNSRKSEFTGLVEPFSVFKDDLTQNNSDSAFVAGFSPLLKSIGKGLGPVKLGADNSEYNALASNTSLAFFGSRLTEDDERELRSWIRVLLAYP